MTKSRKKVWIRWSNAQDTALGTLAAETAIAVAALTSLTERARVASMDLWMRFHALTAGEASRLIVGIAHGSMSMTEIAECLQSAGNTPVDIPASEEARRPLRLFGFALDPGAPAADTGGRLQGHFKVGLTAEEAVGVNLFVYNNGSTALTTGGLVDTLAKYYLIPL